MRKGTTVTDKAEKDRALDASPTPIAAELQNEGGAYQRQSNGVLVDVTPRFIASQSFPARHRYVWSYTIRISNMRDDSIRLLRRYWKLTDQYGRVDEVRGEGVVGQQPTIAPGAHFEYTSAAPLRAASGVMGGHFEMITSSGEEFIAQTPLFSLDSPFDTPTLN